MSPPPYRILSTAPPALEWGAPDRNSSAPVRDIFHDGHRASASFCSDAGKKLALIDIRLNGTPSDAVQPGQSIPDQDGSPYVIVETTLCERDSAFEFVRVLAVRKDVHKKAVAKLASARKEYEELSAAKSDSRLPIVKKMIKSAIEQTYSGWYSDVYLDDGGGELHVGGTVSTGFQTNLQQDGCNVIYRCIEGDDRDALGDGRILHELAVSAMRTLHGYEAEPGRAAAKAVAGG